MQSIKILIGVCTYKRPLMLQACLESFRDLELPEHYETTCVVINNDSEPLPSNLTDNFKTASNKLQFSFQQCIERGIPFARNAILEIADKENYDFCLFLDDDEKPATTWVMDLIAAQEKYQSAAIQGNVINEYERTPWLTSPLLHEKKFTHEEGCAVRVVSTCNVLLHRRLFAQEFHKIRFNEEFALTGGSDKELFLRVQEVYKETCAFANAPLVYETIPKERTTASWFFQRFSRVENNSVIIKITKIGMFKTILRLTPKTLSRALSSLMLLVLLPFTLIIPPLFRCTFIRLLKNAARTKGTITALVGKKSNAYEVVTGY
jgi:succinoglycan biosynthesis protein ExoM